MTTLVDWKAHQPSALFVLLRHLSWVQHWQGEVGCPACCQVAMSCCQRGQCCQPAEETVLVAPRPLVLLPALHLKHVG